MAVKDVNCACSEPQFQKIISSKFRQPSLHLLEDTEEARTKYLTLGVPLHKAALKGDWNAARHILEKDPTLVNAAITKGWATVLHIAAGANHVHFVEELVELMSESDLELQDYKGNTALCFVAAIGNVRIAEIMWRKNNKISEIRGGEGVTPLHMAALQGRSEMATFLYLKTWGVFEQEDWVLLFYLCISNGLNDLALHMLESLPELAYARCNYETALHVLARKASGSSCHHSSRYGKRPMDSCMKQTPVLQIVRTIWRIILSLGHDEMMKIMREPSHVIFSAVEAGNFEFLSELMNTYPDLIWEVNDRNLSIIHIAVLHRQASIFNLIHEIGPIKDFIVTFTDDVDGNNLLHMAAKLAPLDRLNMASGAAFQMMLELLWFEEVKKIMPPSLIEMKNSKGITPRKLFTMEHEELLNKAESWMKGTANSCMVVSTLITTGVFSAAFSIPGGVNDSNGTPNYLEKTSFLIFAISDAAALISSSTSILMFLSILISRYAEEDFFKSLPLKLICGMVALFISIMAMMIAFSSAFFVTYYHGLMWVPNFISVLAFLPIPLFIFLHFQLWSDIVYSTYFCRSLFRHNKRMFS